MQKWSIGLKGGVLIASDSTRILNGPELKIEIGIDKRRFKRRNHWEIHGKENNTIFTWLKLKE